MTRKKTNFDHISRAISELEGADKAKKLVREAIGQGASIQDVVEKGIKKGLDVVGNRYETGEYALGELAYAGSIATELLQELKPILTESKIEAKGVIVMGAVQGDIHDIGKNIVKMLMICRGWEVYDLGVDVAPETFAQKVKEVKADVLGLTALLTTTRPMYKATIDKLKEMRVRNMVKVIIAGNAATDELAKEIGADGVALDAGSGIKICEEWIRK